MTWFKMGRIDVVNRPSILDSDISVPPPYPSNLPEENRKRDVGDFPSRLREGRNVPGVHG